MKVLWTLLKVVLALIIAIPVSIVVLATTLGILGTLVGLAVLVIKLAVFGIVGWAAFRLIGRLVSGPRSDRKRSVIGQLPSAPVDPYYDAAVRELDRELGHAPR